MSKELPGFQMWDFSSAPQWMQELSPHGGDEDWLAACNSEEGEEFIKRLFAGSMLYAGSQLSRHECEDYGVVVYIGAHA